MSLGTEESCGGGWLVSFLFLVSWVIDCRDGRIYVYVPHRGMLGRLKTCRATERYLGR